jgi:hypothetical protein
MDADRITNTKFETIFEDRAPLTYEENLNFYKYDGFRL